MHAHERSFGPKRRPRSYLDAAAALSGALALGAALFAPRDASAQAAPAGAGDTIEYRVRRGDTCVSIARRTWGDARRIDLIHGSNQLGTPPHRLQEGQVLRLPRRAAPLASNAPDAQVTQLRNQVLTFTPERADARRNEPLRRGDRVNTLDNSSAELLFIDETLLALGEETLLVIFGATRDATSAVQPGPEHTLVTGSLRARLAELNGRRPVLPVATPAAQVRLDPGEAQVSVDRARTTRVAVYRGRSQVSAQRHTVRIPEGYGSRTDFGRPPSPPRRLPAAPAWATPAGAVVFAVNTPAAGGDPTAAYAAVYEAPRATTPVASWRVQLARDEAFHDLIDDDERGAAAVRFEAAALVPGRYFLRVSAFDSEGLEGPFGPNASVWVVRPEIARVADGSAYEVRLPEGLLCSIDGEVLRPVSGPLRFTAEGPHDLGCAPVAVQHAARTMLRFSASGGRVEFLPSAPAVANPSPAVAPTSTPTQPTTSP